MVFQPGKEQTSEQIILQPVDVHMQTKTKSPSNLKSYVNYKNELKIYVNIKVKTTQLLEENRGKLFFVILGQAKISWHT